MSEIFPGEGGIFFIFFRLSLKVRQVAANTTKLILE